MRFYSVFFVAAFGSSVIAQAGQNGAETDNKGAAYNVVDPSWSSALLGTGLKTSDQYTDGHIFLTLPLWSTIGRDGTLGGNYFFIEPYSSVGRGGEVATSLGASWRHLFSDQSVRALQEKKGMAKFMEEGWFVGGNVFADMLNTEHHNQFWQMGVGGEVGTRYLELRGNYYVPFTDEKQFASNTSRQTFSSSSSSTSLQSSSAGSGLFAAGNGIVERDFQKTTETISTTTTTTTVTSTTRLFEKGMEGWDAEAALLVPWVDQWMDCRVNGGYFHFNNQPFGPQNGPTGPVRGWKAGAEVRPVPAIVLGSEWYQDERFTGSNWIVSVEFQIPLDRNWKDAFRMRPRHLVEHLAEPVHRQNDAVKVGNRSDETAKVSSKTTTQQTTRVLQNTATETLLASDLIFVNNGSAQGNGIQTGSAGGDGTAEHPADTIALGATLAGTQSNTTGNVWTAYVQAGGPNYTGLATVTGSTHFLSSSQPLTVGGGKIFGGTGPNAVLDGAIAADGIAHPTIQTVSVQGFTILHGSGGTSPIDFANVPTATITNNLIQQATGSGIHLSASTGGTSSTTLTGNTISNSGTDGVNASISGGTFGLTATNNTVTSPTGNGFNLVSMNSTAGATTATVSSNTVSGAGQNGILFAAEQGGDFTPTATGNTVTSSTADGIAFQAGVGGTTSTMTATATGNQVGSSTGNGISATTGAGSTLTLGASGNTITTPVGSGFSFASSGTSTLTPTLTNNTITTPGANGVSATASGTSVLNLTATSNTITTPGTNGFFLQSNTTSAAAGVTADLESNTITGAVGAGVLFQTTNGFGSLTANGNTITGSGGDGINASTTSNLAVVPISLTSNTITNAGGNGITLSDASTLGLFTEIIATVDGNTITGSTLSGINLQFHNVGLGVLSNVNSSVSNTVTGSGSGFSLNVLLTPHLPSNIVLNGVNLSPPVTTP